MDYKIEKNVPVPKIKSGGRIKYPFGKMEVGDSFIVDENYSRELMNKYSNAARNYKKKSPGKSDWRFSCRKTSEGIRVWRVK